MHLREIADYEKALYTDSFAILEVPSLRLLELVPCKTKGGYLTEARMLSGIESPGLPQDRVMLLGSELTVLSLMTHEIVASDSLPLSEGDPKKYLDVDGDGELDSYVLKPHEKILVRSGRTGKEIAYGSRLAVGDGGTSFAAVIGGNEVVLMCTILATADKSELLIETVGEPRHGGISHVVDLK
jgi:hypothetical protein